MTIHSLIYGGGERSKISFSQYSAGQNYWRLELQNNVSIQGTENENPLNGYCICPLANFTTIDGNTRKSYELLYFYSCDNTEFSNWIMLGMTTWDRTNYQKTYQLRKLVQAQTTRYSGASLGYTVPNNSTNIVVYLFGGVGEAQSILSNCETYILNLSSQTMQYSKTISITNEEQAVNFQGILHPMQKTYVFYGGSYTHTSSQSGMKTSVYYYFCNGETIQPVKDTYQYGYYHQNHGSGLFVVPGFKQLYVVGGFDSSEQMKAYCTLLKFNDDGRYQSYSYVNLYCIQGSQRQSFYILTGNYLSQDECSGILLHGFYSTEQKSFEDIYYSNQSYRVIVDDYNSTLTFYPITLEQYGGEVLISNLQLQSHYPGQYLGYGGTIVTTALKFNQNISNKNSKVFLYGKEGAIYAYTKEEIPYLNLYPLVGEQYMLYLPKEVNLSIQHQSIVMIPITKNSLYVDQGNVQESNENTVLRPEKIPYTGYVELESDTIIGNYLNDGTKEVDIKIQLLS